MTTNPHERVTDRKVVFRGRILTLRVDTVELPSGRTTTREIVEHPGAVVILAVDLAGRVGLVRQYRSAIGQTTLELPAGTLEPPETSLACAQRELAEEMGVSAGRWFPLVEFYSSPGFCTELLSVFVATNLALSPGVPEADESIQREWVDLERVPALLAASEVRDAKTIAGLLAFLDRDRAGGAAWHA
jgi:ADP-ribose pyrophosphatase